MSGGKKEVNAKRTQHNTTQQIRFYSPLLTVQTSFPTAETKLVYSNIITGEVNLRISISYYGEVETVSVSVAETWEAVSSFDMAT